MWDRAAHNVVYESEFLLIAGRGMSQNPDSGVEVESGL